MKDEILVSIIMPAFNAAEFIKDSIDSVIKQSYKKWELIVIDDQSIDQTGEVVAAFTDERIKLFKNPKKGVSMARNFGLEKARGEWVAFLDSDDLWLPNKLQDQSTFFNKYDLICSDCFLIIDGKSTEKRYSTTNPPPVANYLEHLVTNNNFIAMLTVTARRDIVLQTGGFDNNFQGVEEYDLWLQILAKGARLKYISEPLAAYRVHAGGISRNILKIMLSNYRLLKKYKAMHTSDQYSDLAEIRARNLLREILNSSRNEKSKLNSRLKSLSLLKYRPGAKQTLAQLIYVIAPRQLHKHRPDLFSSIEVNDWVQKIA